MKIKYKRSLFFIIFLVNFYSLMGQNKRLEKANKKYQERVYIDAGKIYERLVRSGKIIPEVLKKLGNTYYFNAQYDQSAKWYEKLVDIDKNLADEPIYFLRYSQSLRALGENKKSENFYNQFLKTSNYEGTFKDVEAYLKIIEKNSNRYSMEPFKFNTKAIDLGGFVQGDKMYFTSSLRKVGAQKVIDGWTNQSFLDVFTVVYDSINRTFYKSNRAKQNINTKYHDASLTITKDGKTMYITRSNSTPNTLSVEKITSKLKIYRAHLNEANEWDNFEDLSINSDNFSTAHPVLSPDEKILYFVSDKPGGFGQTDIYQTFISNNGILSTPQNLGPEVNTKGRESFPFVSASNELYFSSDGHFGLGGYDVFYIDLKDKFLRKINVGEPVNSLYDDFAFVINSEGNGAVSSNRPGGKGSDDIYVFTETKPIKEAINTHVQGVISDVKTNVPIQNANVVLKDSKGQLVNSILSNSKGEYKIYINKFYDNYVYVSATDYEGKDAFIKTSLNTKDLVMDFQLRSSKIEIVDNKDIREDLNMPAIYFDFDKHTLKEDAVVQLEKVVALLKEYPELQLEVRSHTDSRGNDEYNLSLSKRRARATVDYIVQQGISSNRIVGRGFGETKLINDCDNVTKCSDEQHVQNRRSEFVIVRN